MQNIDISQVVARLAHRPRPSQHSQHLAEAVVYTRSCSPGSGLFLVFLRLLCPYAYVAGGGPVYTYCPFWGRDERPRKPPRKENS